MRRGLVRSKSLECCSDGGPPAKDLGVLNVPLVLFYVDRLDLAGESRPAINLKIDQPKQ